MFWQYGKGKKEYTQDFFKTLIKGRRTHVGHFLAYVGNGGYGIDSSYKNAINGMGGVFDKATCLPETPADGANIILENNFHYPDHIFCGFHARRRTKKGWEWYCTDGAWHLTSAEMPEKALFPDGANVAHLFSKRGRTVVMVATWKIDGDDTFVNTGYDIFKHRLMGHALTGLNETRYNNTRAAFENGYANGYRYFEVDIIMTSDNRLVCCHGWSEEYCPYIGFEYSKDFDKHMTYERFMKMKVHGNEVMDVKDLYQLVKSHPDCFFEIDIHLIENKKLLENIINKLLDNFNRDLEVINKQLLVQFNSRKMYNLSESLHGFIYKQYNVGESVDIIDKLITHNLDKGLCAIAVKKRVITPEVTKLAHNAGMYVLAYTVVSNKKRANKMFKFGADTVCTDFVLPSEVN